MSLVIQEWFDKDLQPPLAAGGAFSLNCEPGTFVVTGVAATLVADRSIDAQPGAFTLTGVLAEFAKGYFINAEVGAFTLTGVDASLIADRTLDAQPGSFTITGVEAILAKGYFLDAQAGAFILTGVDATLAKGYFLNAEVGAFTLTGVDADLLQEGGGAFSLNAEPGSFAITGASATLVADRFIDAQPGSLTLTGVAATFEVARALVAESGSFIITGVAAELETTGTPVTPAEGAGGGGIRRLSGKIPYLDIRKLDPLSSIVLPQDPKSRQVAIKAIKVIHEVRHQLESENRAFDDMLAKVTETLREVTFFVEIRKISLALSEVEKMILTARDSEIRMRETREAEEQAEIEELMEIL